MPRFELMFTAPCEMPNGLQGTDEGLWIADQLTDDVLLVDENGKLIRRLQTETENDPSTIPTSCPSDRPVAD